MKTKRNERRRRRRQHDLNSGQISIRHIVGQPGYEFQLPIHPLDALNEGIWNARIKPGDLVRVFDRYSDQSNPDPHQIGILVSWCQGFGKTSPTRYQWNLRREYEEYNKRDPHEWKMRIIAYILVHGKHVPTPFDCDWRLEKFE